MTTRSKSECGVPSPLTIEPARNSTLASGYLLSKISFATLTRLLRNSVLFLESRVSHGMIEFTGSERIPFKHRSQEQILSASPQRGDVLAAGCKLSQACRTAHA